MVVQSVGICSARLFNFCNREKLQLKAMAETALKALCFESQCEFQKLIIITHWLRNPNVNEAQLHLPPIIVSIFRFIKFKKKKKRSDYGRNLHMWQFLNWYLFCSEQHSNLTRNECWILIDFVVILWGTMSLMW